MMDSSLLRDEMVSRQIESRGVRSRQLLDAMRKVPREQFLPEALREFAYDDTPLPIAAEQTISQPYIVAFMIEGLALSGGESVLEIGTGSGYAAAVLAEIAGKVFTIERIEELASAARSTLARLGYDNVEVIHGDGTLGLPAAAPFDAIVVAAGGPSVPESLKEQLRIGGRLVIPVGSCRSVQELVRVTRLSKTEFQTEDLADVRFVPLIGEQGWTPPQADVPAQARDREVIDLICDHSDSFLSIESASLESLLDRIGHSDIVLIGEASHGTSEFYKMRSRITRELITKKNFNFVAIEGDWPDAARIDNFVRHFDTPPSEWTAFARFPTWMWRNEDVREFVDWLRVHNSDLRPEQRVAFHGLDLYSLYTSIREVLKYLDDVDPEAAEIARQRYGCLTPWQADPATYGRAALSGSYRSCEADVVGMLVELSARHRDYALHDGERFLDAEQNARLVANAERYYRVMYYGSRESWNLRDAYMFETLKTLRKFHWPNNKAIIWAHNSHVGDAAATDMSRRGEFNIGHLCRREFGNRAYSIGFGTDSGTVAATSDWDGPMQIMNVRPSQAGSYERLCHQTGLDAFMLSFRHVSSEALLRRLSETRLERAIGVIYRPDSELASHYFHAVLPKQFDEYIWFDRTRAVQPFAVAELEGVPDTYPFGV